MVETVMDDHEIKQLNDYAMTKWVNEMQIRNSALQYGTESVVVRLFNTYGPGEYYSPYRSVNCRFLYCALYALPWTVYRGHSRTSTFLADTVRTVANKLMDLGQKKILPAPELIRGLQQLRATNSSGRKNYFGGKPRTGSKWFFFPLALAVKTRRYLAVRRHA